jgi:hypothetical protein
VVDLFQERFRELPAFQRYMELLEDVVIQYNEYSIEELATRLLMASENGLNWDTLCQNCGVLMDDNYAKHCEIEQLKEQISHPMQMVCGTCMKAHAPFVDCSTGLSTF